MAARFVAPVLAFAAALAAATVAPARAADASKPLRILVYDVTYSTSTLRREHTSGFTNSPSGATGSVAGSGLVDRRFSSDETGTLTVAIVAATQDGGLVADVTFSGKSITQPAVRVAILKDGRLSYDPKFALAAPSIGLLPFLARGMVAERNVNPGSTWTVAAQAPESGATTYTIASLDGDRATIDLTSSITVKGASSFAETAQGRTVYATDRLSPFSLDLRSRTHRDVSAEQSDTIDAHLVATLRSDVFPKAG